MAVEHLIACGRTRIAHISGDPTYAAAQDRLQGAREGLAAAGLSFVGEPMFSEWTENWGRNAAAMLLAKHPDIDGVFAASDQIARGVLDTARDLGRSVPGDLAVVGYDNWEILATNSRPELTTVDANRSTWGASPHSACSRRSTGARLESGTTQLPVRLIIRGSTIARR